MIKLDQMFEMDEVECVMVATGEDLVDESTEEMDVVEVEDEDDGDFYDSSIEDIGATFTMEDLVVNEYRITRDYGMDTINEDTIDNAIMDIDPDVEDIEDDDDEYEDD